MLISRPPLSLPNRPRANRPRERGFIPGMTGGLLSGGAGGGGGVLDFTLSNDTLSTNAVAGDTVGILAGSGGSAPYTFEIVEEE